MCGLTYQWFNIPWMYQSNEASAWQEATHDIGQAQAPTGLAYAQALIIVVDWVDINNLNEATWDRGVGS